MMKMTSFPENDLCRTKRVMYFSINLANEVLNYISFEAHQ